MVFWIIGDAGGMAPARLYGPLAFREEVLLPPAVESEKIP